MACPCPPGSAFQTLACGNWLAITLLPPGFLHEGHHGWLPQHKRLKTERGSREPKCFLWPSPWSHTLSFLFPFHSRSVSTKHNPLSRGEQVPLLKGVSHNLWAYFQPPWNGDDYEWIMSLAADTLVWGPRTNSNLKYAHGYRWSSKKQTASQHCFTVRAADHA